MAEDTNKNIQNIVYEMQCEINSWLNFVTSANQCAYTDRKLELILSLADELKKEYDKI